MIIKQQDLVKLIQIKQNLLNFMETIILNNTQNNNTEINNYLNLITDILCIMTIILLINSIVC